MDPIPVRLSKELQARVSVLSEELSISRSAVLRLAVSQWLDAVEKRGTNPMLREEPAPFRAPPATSVRYPSGKAPKKKPNL